MLVGRLAQGQTIAAVKDNLLPVYVQPCASNLPAFEPGASHTTFHALDDQTFFKLGDCSDNDSEMSKVARIGKREEMDFAEEAGTWPGICVSEKLPKNGDYILAYNGRSGVPAEPRILVDNKDKAATTEGDVEKLVRDAKERSIPVAAIVTRQEAQLRQSDKDNRWACKDGIWVLIYRKNKNRFRTAWRVTVGCD
jgi:hypothetical protein